MEIRIRETGEVKELSLIDAETKVDCIQDFVGNTGALDDGQFTLQDDGMYLADEETYDWWAKVAADEEDLGFRIGELTAVHGYEAVIEAIDRAGAVDLEDRAASINAALDELENDKTPAE